MKNLQSGTQLNDISKVRTAKLQCILALYFPHPIADHGLSLPPALRDLHPLIIALQH